VLCITKGKTRLLLADKFKQYADFSKQALPVIISKSKKGGLF
jgi:hypothetical protein